MLRISLFLIFCLSFLFSFKTDELPFYLPGQNDTLMATVSYGDDYLLNGRADLSEEELNHLIDSLKSIPTQVKTVSDLLFFKSVRKKSPEEIEITLDSLFKLDTIPYGLINELNLWLVNYSPPALPEKILTIHPSKEKSKHPSGETYAGEWNIHHPFNYSNDLLLNDSTFYIPLTENCSFHHPVSRQSIEKYGGKIGSPFGWRDGKNHNGVDVELDQWDTVQNAFDGTVRFAKMYSGYGKVVVVRHPNGLETLYAHLARINVKSGQHIKAGDVIGLGGSTGNSTGSHLHFEIRYKGVPLNPANVIDFNEKKLLSDTLLIRKMKNALVCIPVGVNYHTVERGDYLRKIAQRYGISVNELCLMNNISSGTRLRIGQKLRVSN